MLKASFSYQIYSNGEFSVNKFLVKECGSEDFCDVGDVITVLGNNVPNHKKIVYVLEGAWEQNKKMKEVMQFRLYGYREEKPQSGKEVLAYMESGIIKGIGKRNAALIYERFGEKSLDVIENDTEKLLEIKGFGKKTIEIIKESYLKNLKSKDSLIFLARLGIHSKQGTKVYEKFKEKTSQIVSENPYELCNVKGISFEIADSVAKSLGVSENAEKRIEAGVLWTLKLLENEDGNIGSPIKTLEKRLYQLLGLTKNSENMRIVNLVSSNMVRDKKVIISNELCFRPHMYDMETECASNIVRILKGKPFKVKKDYMEVIKKTETELHISLDEIQRMAVEKAVLENFLVITGGPGSGKTTTILSIIKVLETIFRKCTIKLLAPTGRAARRMSETTGYYASTIHSGLRISTETDDDYGAESLEEDIIIVDEVSMLYLRIATLLLRAVDDGKKVILIGDCDQLPSVGPGAVLRDIIRSNAVPVVKLERIFRQDKESNIYVNSRKIKNGSTDLNEGSDFLILESDGFAESADIMAKIYEEKVKEYGISNVACLTPYRKHTAGCEHM
ncbi:MAG: AAA family ATPase, partial [Lachnospiraceae bacterium]|nr:AAA family ATPase [Lachnospiraceae bacterium]